MVFRSYIEGIEGLHGGYIGQEFNLNRLGALIICYLHNRLFSLHPI